MPRSSISRNETDTHKHLSNLLSSRCHVMERESFESQAVAKVLNKSFVSIKASSWGAGK